MSARTACWAAEPLWSQHIHAPAPASLVTRPGLVCTLGHRNWVSLDNLAVAECDPFKRLAGRTGRVTRRSNPDAHSLKVKQADLFHVLPVRELHLTGYLGDPKVISAFLPEETRHLEVHHSASVEFGRLDNDLIQHLPSCVEGTGRGARRPRERFASLPKSL